MKKLLAIIIFLFVMTGTAYALPYIFIPQPQRTWTAPTENVDGTPYDDEGGYVVYCKPSSQAEFTDALSFRITDPATTIIYLVDYPCLGMTGQIDFVVTAIDTSGNESANSNMVTVPLVPEIVPVAPVDLK